MSPVVTVLMSVYNGEKYLREAMDSILNQTFADFEFIIIDDGSTDGTFSIVKSYKDLRIRLIKNKANIGLTKSLNKGMRLAGGKYIARMDCDDISSPNRLNIQVAFMEKNQDVGVCGSWIKTFGSCKEEIWKYPVENDLISSRLIFDSPLAHPSIIMRKELMDKNNLKYDEHCELAQDWKLWQECRSYLKITNIPEVLLLYRIHNRSIGSTEHNRRRNIIENIDKKNLSGIGIYPNKDELSLHRNIASSQFVNSIYDVGKWLLKLHDANKVAGVYPEPAFSIILSQKWYCACNKVHIKGISIWTLFNESPLRQYVKLGLYDRQKFKLKSLMKEYNI